jgi:hypothetical protein
MSSVVRKLRNIGLSKDEFLCLKALTLFKSDFGFMDVSRLDTFRQKCLATLRKQTKERAGVLALSSLYRYDSLLILMSDIKSISIRFVHAVFMFHMEQKVAMPTLLHDMLSQSQNLFGMMALRVTASTSGCYSATPGSSCGNDASNNNNNNFDMIEEGDEVGEEESHTAAEAGFKMPTMMHRR